ncbi:MAG: hypothetical protein ACYSYW_05830 [Planctomycetota bacterium]
MLMPSGMTVSEWLPNKRTRVSASMSISSVGLCPGWPLTTDSMNSWMTFGGTRSKPNGRLYGARPV